MRRLRPLACAFALGACVTSHNRYSLDRTSFVEVPVAQTEHSNHRCDLRLCFVAGASRNAAPGAVQRILINALSPHFTKVVMQPVYPPEDCDIALKFDNYMSGDKADLYSAHTNEFLGRFETIFRRMGPLVCSAVKDGTPLFNKIPGASAIAYRVAKPAAAVAAPAAPAQGVSREELAQIVAAAVKQGQAEPAPETRAASPSPRFTANERANDLAVIVGVESYSDIAAKAPYAERDAEAFKSFVRALGVPERNIVLLKGSKAVKSSFEKNLEAWLPRMAKSDSRVYFYFSGHGAPDIKSGQAYLVPWDGDPNFLESTAYPVSRLYEKLGALPAKQVLVAMDSCFSGAGGRSVLASGARPLVGKIETGAIPAKVTVLAASAANEISGSLDDRQHGAFTWFLLEGLNSGRTSAKDLHAYLTPKVQDEARRLNRDQTPQLTGPDLSLR